MEFEDLVLRTRSYRRFDESKPVGVDTLRDLVDLARRVPSAMNRQPLKYILCCGPRSNGRVFETLAWAGGLKEWSGPQPGERPTAYVVVLVDRELNPNAATDIGIAAQTILLGASERGLGGCMMGAITRPALRSALSIDEELDIGLVIALGTPAERIVLEDAAPGASISYYREADGSHHVPKRTLGEVVVGQFEE
ncbi:MAG: nitroreductase family protein [Spirochaetota bacterium]